ncbi:uncharacterized protein [Typha latifolia]|uniref:uncharacterized protein n=1 Tax=Typha latifolia TaxID=4733 RepID=UPI003C2EC9DC
MFLVSSEIGFEGILFGTSLALPRLRAVLPAVMLLDAGDVAERPGRVMVDARRHRAYVDTTPGLAVLALPELGRDVVAAEMEPEVLLALESLLAHLADEAARRDQRLRRHGDDLGIRDFQGCSSSSCVLLFVAIDAWEELFQSFFAQILEEEEKKKSHQNS